jgi:ABC-type uncharacterized transport system permease subunit
MFSIWLGAYNQGLANTGLALGVYLTLRELNFADSTVDGLRSKGESSVDAAHGKIGAPIGHHHLDGYP